MYRGGALGRVRALVISAVVAIPVTAVGIGTQSTTALADGSTRLISSSGTVFLTATPAGNDGVQSPEIRSQPSDSGPTSSPGHLVDPSGSAARTVATSNPGLKLSFDGLNHRQQRLANGGNQFSLEPPDQGLCAGNGSVMESINDVTRVWDTAGNARTGVVDLNTFYGYPPAIIRATRVFGPFVTDPSCLFDSATQRWFNVILTLDTNSATGGFLGTNHLDLAVSQTADPAGGWNIYKLPVQDDGTGGTPDHGCSSHADANGNPAGHGPCLGDYPHIGADANGFYVTTNEYSFNGPEFHGAQVYAFSKRALAAGASVVTVTQIDTHGADKGNSGFTIWPAQSPGRQESAAHGTEYFLSSNAADEAHGNGVAVGPRTSTQLLVWALTNTTSLNSNSPAVHLSHTVLPVGRYSKPDNANQKSGHIPLAECLNNTACATFLNGVPDPFTPETLASPDSNDTRMQQVTFDGDHLWGALDTKLTLNGVDQAGIEWFTVSPEIEAGSVRGRLSNSGYVGLAGNNLTYPAIGVNHDGRGIMAFTVLGNDYYPSSGYAPISRSGVGSIHIAAAGVGPEDGFSGYKFYGNPPGTIRPRWGDYGATAVVGNSIWFASEYIGQTCTLAQYESTPFGSCGGTRTALANWDTRVNEIRIDG